jgi:pyrroline-5-carboxylate reductase
MKIAFIGGGNMATAIIGGLLQQGWQTNAIRVVEIDARARARIARDLGVATDTEPAAGIAGADCVVLAIKPQQMRSAAQELKVALASQLIISIAAGIRCKDLSRWLGGYTRIVRVMPNTPSLVLSGISGLYAMPEVAAADRTLAESVLNAVGRTLWLEREEQMDAITAVSASGPAYVFYFIESLQQAASELGISAEQSRQLALDTFAGAVKMAALGNDDAATLRARVTSKGGTTERALAILESDAVKQSVIRAVKAAAERSRELGDELGAD